MRSLLVNRGLSHKVVLRVLNMFKEEPEFASSSKELVQAADHGIFQTVRCMETVAQQDGSTFDWHFCDPNLLLARTLCECPHLARLYVNAVRERPCAKDRPWSIAVCYDDFTPGSLSHPLTHLKTMTLAYNFLELGPTALGVEATWLIPVAVRNAYLAGAVGGLSACLAKYFKKHLGGPLACKPWMCSALMGQITRSTHA